MTTHRRGPLEDDHKYTAANVAVATCNAVESPESRNQSKGHSNDEQTASTHTQRSCLSREERNVVIWRKGRFALPMGLGRSKSWLRRTARFAFCRPGGTARASFCLPPTPPLTPRGAFQRARRARAPVGNAVRTHRGRPDRAICRTRCVRSFSDGAASTRAGWPNHVFSHAGCARYLALSHSKMPRRVVPPYFLTHRMRSGSCCLGK